MLQELLNLVQENATESVINNPAVPNEQNSDVVAEATNTVASGLRNMVAGGGLESVLSMFNNQTSGNNTSNNGLLSNPIVNMMVGHLTQKLMGKFNMNSANANSVASNLIPGVLGNLINKVNEPANNGFSLDGLLNSITGGKVHEQQQSGGLNLQDLLKQFSGSGGGAQSGGGGIADIISSMAAGAQGQQQRNGGGGLLDMIKGFL